MKVERILCLEEGTCCHRAALHLQQRVQASQSESPLLVPDFQSFYAVTDWMRHEANENDVTILPDVNEVTHNIKLDVKFLWVEELSFSLENPPIYLAKSPKPYAENMNRCATIRALRQLVVTSDESFPHDFEDAPNTQEAARRASQGACGYCITNQAGLDRFKLTPVRQLPQRKPYWEVFRVNRDRMLSS